MPTIAQLKSTWDSLSNDDKTKTVTALLNTEKHRVLLELDDASFDITKFILQLIFNNKRSYSPYLPYFESALINLHSPSHLSEVLDILPDKSAKKKALLLTACSEKLSADTHVTSTRVHEMQLMLTLLKALQSYHDANESNLKATWEAANAAYNELSSYTDFNRIKGLRGTNGLLYQIAPLFSRTVKEAPHPDKRLLTDTMRNLLEIYNNEAAATRQVVNSFSEIDTTIEALNDIKEQINLFIKALHTFDALLLIQQIKPYHSIIEAVSKSFPVIPPHATAPPIPIKPSKGIPPLAAAKPMYGILPRKNYGTLPNTWESLSSARQLTTILYQYDLFYKTYFGDALAKQTDQSEAALKKRTNIEKQYTEIKNQIERLSSESVESPNPPAKRCRYFLKEFFAFLQEKDFTKAENYTATNAELAKLKSDDTCKTLYGPFDSLLRLHPSRAYGKLPTMPTTQPTQLAPTPASAVAPTLPPSRQNNYSLPLSSALSSPTPPQALSHYGATTLFVPPTPAATLPASAAKPQAPKSPAPTSPALKPIARSNASHLHYGFMPSLSALSPVAAPAPLPTAQPQYQVVNVKEEKTKGHKPGG